MAEDERHRPAEGSFDGANEYEKLKRQTESGPVQDSVEAEHMAHAMDPYYEQAGDIDRVAREGERLVRSQEEREEEDWITPGQYQTGDLSTRNAADREELHHLERADHLRHASDSLNEGAEATRRAGDEAGDIASSVYRRTRNEDPPLTEERSNDQR